MGETTLRHEFVAVTHRGIFSYRYKTWRESIATILVRMSELARFLRINTGLLNSLIENRALHSGRDAGIGNYTRVSRRVSVGETLHNPAVKIYIRRQRNNDAGQVAYAGINA